MVRNLVAILATLCVCACSGKSEPAPVSVSNLTIGLMRKGDDGEWRVYSPGNTFPLIPNGPCVVAEKERTCMWYGFEFEFAPEQAPVAAANVDFSSLLYNNYTPTIEHPIKRRKTSEDETDRGVPTFKQQVPTPESGLEEL